MFNFHKIRIKTNKFNKFRKSKFTELNKTTLEKSDEYRYLASLNFKQNKLEDAVKNYNMALELNPKNLKALIELGLINLKQNKIIESLEYFKKALEIDPNCNIAHNKLVEIYISQKNYEEALIHSHKELEFAPTQYKGGCLNNIANILENLGKRDEAINYYKKAIEHDPTNVNIYDNLAILYQGEGMIAEAEGMLKKAIEISPLKSNSRKLRLAVMISKIETRHEDSIALFKSVIETETESDPLSKAHFSLGTFNLIIKNNIEAENSYTKAIKYNEKYLLSYLFLFEVLLRLNNTTKVETYYKKLLENLPNFNYIGIAQKCYGLRLMLATEHFLKLELEINPTSDEARKLIEELNQN